jgi:RNA polymerase sigma-70 factor (ECF subfamily)
MTMTSTPISLLERLRRQFDPQAWARFVELYAPLIYACGRRAGLHDHDAADLTQEVFVTLLQVLPTFTYNRHKSFRRWLQTITLNKWRNLCKQPERRRVRPANAELDAVAAANNLESFWEAEYQQHVLKRALAIMQADFQEKTWKACWETVVAGRPAAEVAAELGVTVGAVYAAKVRVLERLRQELQGLLE